MIRKNIKKILVPMDGSKNSMRGLDEAIYLARQCHAIITGLYVIPIYPRNFTDAIMPYQLHLTKSAKKFMESAKTACAQKGIMFISKIVFGSPSVEIEEMAKKIKVSSLRTVTQYLEALEKKGYILRTKNKKRSIELIRKPDRELEEIVMLPIIGAAACGGLNVYAEESFNEFIQVSRSFLGNRRENDVMIIRAFGLSMQDAGIEDGDLVMIECTEDIKNGDVVTAVIDGMAVIKKITFTQNAVILDPVTSIGSYQQIVLRRDFRVLGKVIHVIKAVQHEDVELVPIT